MPNRAFLRRLSNHRLPEPGRFRHCRAILSRIGGAEIHALAGSHDGLPTTHSLAVGAGEQDLVSYRGQFASGRFRNSGLHADLTSLETQLGEPRRIERLLHIHAEIDYVGDELRVRLSL